MNRTPPTDATTAGEPPNAITDTPAPVTPPRRTSRVKRFLRRALLGVLVLLLLAQIPFIYRRFELGALHRSLQATHARRTPNTDSTFREYVGVVHVHTSLGGHSTGTPAEVIKAAQSNRLDFVVMTEHTENDFDTAAMTLAGTRGGVLFLPGNETQTADGSRFLVTPGAAMTGEAGRLTTEDFTTRERATGRAVFAAYPDDFKAWDAAEIDGIEIYNLFTNARRARPFTLFFDSLWSLGGGYPELIFTRFYERPTNALARWDELAARRAAPLSALAGNDAHANVGAHLRLASGERLIGVQLDPYERSFRIVRMHVLLPAAEQLNEATLLAALRTGRSFIGFDVFGDTNGFRFTAMNEAETRTMGEQITLTNETSLRVRVPVESRVVLFRNGERVTESRGAEVRFDAQQPGAYRVEVYLEGVAQLADKPWVISNHIKVK